MEEEDHRKIDIIDEIIREFSIIEKDLINIKKTENKVDTEYFSNRYMKSLKEIFEEIEEDDNLSNHIFFWKIFHIIYLKKDNSKGKELVELFQNYLKDEDDDLIKILFLGDFLKFNNKIKKISSENQDINKIILEIISELNKRDHYFIRDSNIKKIQNERDFLERFNENKLIFKELLEKLTQILSENEFTKNKKFKKLIICLNFLSGDEKTIIKICKDKFLSIIPTYILFIDPTVEENKFNKFIELYLNSYKMIDNKKIEKEEYKSDMSLIENEEDEIYLKILFSILSNQSKPHESLQFSMEIFFPYFYYHLGELLYLNYNMEIYLNKNLKENYFINLLNLYLQFLIEEKISFQIFNLYYCEIYDYKDNVNDDILTSAIFVNLKDRNMVEFLENNNALIYFERILEIAITRNLPFNKQDLLLYLTKVKNSNLLTEILKFYFEKDFKNTNNFFDNEKTRMIIKIEQYRNRVFNKEIDPEFLRDLIKDLKNYENLNIIFLLELLTLFYNSIIQMNKLKIDLCLNLEDIFETNYVFQVIKLKENNFKNSRYNNLFENMNDLLINLM